MKRQLWRHALKWRFRLFQRHRYRNLVIERLENDLPVVVLPQVFNPKLFRSGEFLVQELGRDGLLQPAKRVLDLGTGSGAGAVTAARAGCQVVAVDINPAAVRCTRINALLNEVEERVDARQGDLFEPVAGQRFDLVLFNPPYYRGIPSDPLDQAWRAPDVIERFAAGLDGHLTPSGQALLVLSSDGERNAFLAALHAGGFITRAVARRDLGNETMTVYQVARAC